MVDIKMPGSKQSVLRFVMRSTGNPFDLMSRFHPKGKTVLNRTEWRGKERRSCGVSSVQMRPYSAGSNEPRVVDVEVSYRPKGCIVYVGNTKYDGWTALVVDRKPDGTLLDGRGNPLPEGAEPVYRAFEVYEDVDFNEMDFGEFVGEFDVQGIRHVQFDDLFRQAEGSAFSTAATFVAPRRHRPMVKIVLSNAPSGTGSDGYSRIVHINNYTPHLRQVVMDELAEVLNGFVEGRYSMTGLSTGDFVFIELSSVLVDCTPNEEGKDSRFNCLDEYVPESFFEDQARRLMATYAVEVSVVDGPKRGLVLRSLDASK
jgi:hypothetical protein